VAYVTAAPELLSVAAADLASLGSTIGVAQAAAAVPTSQIAAAASDEVSAAIATVFSNHALQFQALSAQAAAFHAQFAQTLNSGAAAYASTEAATLQHMLAGLWGIPGTNGAASTAQALQNLPTAAANAAQDILGNTGTGNIGIGNTGNNNVGIGNSGTGNVGIANVQPIQVFTPIQQNNLETQAPNIGMIQKGFGNRGLLNFGNQNSGAANIGNGLVGFGLTGNNLQGIGIPTTGIQIAVPR